MKETTYILKKARNQVKTRCMGKPLHINSLNAHDNFAAGAAAVADNF
jgi:hypothetical protein